MSQVEPFTGDGRRIVSLHQLNLLPDPEKMHIYRTLLPTEMLSKYGIDPENPVDQGGHPLWTVVAHPGGSLATLSLKHAADASDPLLYLQITDTPNNQIEVLLFVVNDPDAPRFPVDQAWPDQLPKFDADKRNIEAEVAAMQAGLAPGQVRAGLRLTRRLMGIFEHFVARLSHDMFLLSPLAYHNAILFERYGCNYIQGQRFMEYIHEAFTPSEGLLYQRLDGSTPFRQTGMEQTVRGRSWAIYDGILGVPFDGVRQYKRVGREADACTFPDARW